MSLPMLRCDAPEPTGRRPAESIGPRTRFRGKPSRLTTAQHGMQDVKHTVCLISFGRSSVTLIALGLHVTRKAWATFEAEANK